MAKKVTYEAKWETAQRVSQCHGFGKHSIEKGELCLTIRTGNWVPPSNYCETCAGPHLDVMLAQLQAAKNS